MVSFELQHCIHCGQHNIDATFDPSQLEQLARRSIEAAFEHFEALLTSLMRVFCTSSYIDIGTSQGKCACEQARPCGRACFAVPLPLWIQWATSCKRKW